MGFSSLTFQIMILTNFHHLFAITIHLIVQDCFTTHPHLFYHRPTKVIITFIRSLFTAIFFVFCFHNISICPTLSLLNSTFDFEGLPYNFMLLLDRLQCYPSVFFFILTLMTLPCQPFAENYFLF